MPIHLAPISRRQFLRRTLAAGAALALPRGLLGADAKPADPDSWALLSDPHLAADRARVVRGANMADNFTAVAREVLALPKQPAGVFINGDCACDRGETGDYAMVGRLLEPLRQDQMPIHLALGNHDNRERFWDAFKDEKAAPRPLADRQVALLPTARANWFILDSLETTASTPGLLGHPQLDWLSKSLDAHPDKPALVMVHHNPGLDGNMGLKDTVALFEILRPRKQVKAYFFGHTHVWKVEQETSGLHLVNLPAVGYTFAKGVPCGWAHANLEPEGMRLELRCLDTTHKDHGQVVQLKWRG